MAGTHILTQICRYQVPLTMPNAVIAEIDQNVPEKHVQGCLSIVLTPFLILILSQ